MSDRSMVELPIWLCNIPESGISFPLKAHSDFAGNDAVRHLNYQ
jgi:hypothetical protein